MPTYFVLCHDRPGAEPLRMRLTEEHWSFMDAYADRMIARGPTLTDDGIGLRGSMHIVELPDDSAAHVFAYEEPNYRAGAYETVEIHRWRDLLGRTMWDFTGDADRPRYLVVVRAPTSLPPAAERLIVGGELVDPEGTATGLAYTLQADSRTEAERLAGPGADVLRWTFGGRPGAAGRPR